MGALVNSRSTAGTSLAGPVERFGTVAGMRWERLFADLEAEAAELEVRDRDAEIAERTRAELAGVRWAERVRGATGRRVTVTLAGAQRLVGVVRYVGPDWVLLDGGPVDLLVPAHAVLGVEGVGALAPGGSERVPFTWAAAWRTLSRDRLVVRVVRCDGSTVRGTVGRVGADFAEIDRAAEGDVGPLPRDASAGGVVLVPFAAVQVVHAPRGDS